MTRTTIYSLAVNLVLVFVVGCGDSSDRSRPVARHEPPITSPAPEESHEPAAPSFPTTPSLPADVPFVAPPSGPAPAPAVTVKLKDGTAVEVDRAVVSAVYSMRKLARESGVPDAK